MNDTFQQILIEADKQKYKNVKKGAEKEKKEEEKAMKKLEKEMKKAQLNAPADNQQ